MSRSPGQSTVAPHRSLGVFPPLDWTVPDSRLSVEGCELDPDVSARTLKAMALSRLLAYIYARGRSQQESNLEIVERIDRQVAALRTAEAGGRAAVASHADGDPTLDVSVVLTIVGISLDNLDELLDQLAASRLLDDQEDEV